MSVNGFPICDDDADTCMELEQAADDDAVRLSAGGDEALAITNSGTAVLVDVRGAPSQGANTLFRLTDNGGSTFKMHYSGSRWVATYPEAAMSFGGIQSDLILVSTVALSGSARISVFGGEGGDAVYHFQGANDVGMGLEAANTLGLYAGDALTPVMTVADTGRATISNVLALKCVSAAPTGGAKGEVYCDSDLTVPCFHNGTNWVQMDDYSTVCS